MTDPTKVDFQITTYLVGNTIGQEVRHADPSFPDPMQVVYRGVIDAQEKEVRKVLISMGWIPPSAEVNRLLTTLEAALECLVKGSRIDELNFDEDSLRRTARHLNAYKALESHIDSAETAYDLVLKLKQELKL